MKVTVERLSLCYVIRGCGVDWGGGGGTSGILLVNDVIRLMGKPIYGG